MNEQLEGTYLGSESTEYLLQQVLALIQTGRGYSVNTIPAVLGRHTTIHADSPDNWCARGTRLTLPNSINLTNRTKFRTLVTSLPTTEDSFILIPAIYRYAGSVPGTTDSVCELVASGSAITLEEPGWVEIAELTETSILLQPTDTYYLTFLTNVTNLGLLGYSAVMTESTPWLSFNSVNLGNLSSAPANLIMDFETSISVFAELVLNATI